MIEVEVGRPVRSRLFNFGDTADKDRASVRGRNTGGGGREGEANSSW
jgi:hypothetical protein